MLHTEWLFGKSEIVTEHNMVAAKHPLAAQAGPPVRGNENIMGHRSVAVPGAVAGLTLALRELGTKPLAEVLDPAIQFADAGVPVSWHFTLLTAVSPTWRPCSSSEPVAPY